MNELYIGATVEALVNGGQWCSAKVIAIYENRITVSGEAEIAICRDRGRHPVGICLPMTLIRIKEAGGL